MELPDYYAILRVAPTADLETIRLAYRKRAAECHPDHGGNHRDMVSVNEAWFILSNPESRRLYDAARFATWDAAAQQKAAETANQAHSFAQQYPKSWSEFSEWLGRISGDFSGAQYGSVPGARGGNFPTADNSYSGTTFIIVGAICGGLLGLLLGVSALITGTAPFFVAIKAGFFAVGLLATAGGWIGRFIHGAVASALRSATASAYSNHAVPPAEVHRVVPCKSCGQKLRLPMANKVITATCPKCKSRFDVAAA